jgi:hypothetical protein
MGKGTHDAVFREVHLESVVFSGMAPRKAISSANQLYLTSFTPIAPPYDHHRRRETIVDYFPPVEKTACNCLRYYLDNKMLSVPAPLSICRISVSRHTPGRR